MSAYVEVVSRQDLAVKIHYWAQEILRNNATCGLGKTLEGKCRVVWPGLVAQWIYRPEEHGQYVGTLDRLMQYGERMGVLRSVSEHLPPDHSDAESVEQ